jgi:hypothetical protein
VITVQLFFGYGFKSRGKECSSLYCMVMIVSVLEEIR